MPQNGLLLSPNNSKAGVYDKDAVSYFSRAGVTDATAKSQINAFVKGVKNLGLYNSMVCWPLRSSQNAGTGTTAYSLGGLGTYNYSLNNSPTWDSNGIITNGTNQFATATIPTSSQWTLIAIMARSNNGDTAPKYYWGLYNFANNSLAGATYYLKDGGLGVFQSENGGNNWSPSRPIANATTNVGFQSVAYSETGPSANVSLNGAFSAQTGVRNLSAVRQDRMILGRRSDGGGTDSAGTHSFYTYINSQISNSVVESIRTLYKTTLGQGLGLP